MNTRRFLAVAALAALLVVTAGCDDEEEGIRPTMANIWPHADGSSWTYDMDLTSFEPYPYPEGADSLPSFAEIHTLLQQPMAGDVDTTVAYIYELGFDGEVTTDAGVTAQRVVETMTPVEAAGGFAVAAPAPERLLRTIALARPDLRPAIAAELGLAPDKAAGFARVGPPLLMGGYAFAYEDTGYFGYGDLYSSHSWVYLAESLRYGQEFSLQLAVGLADDIWLHGRIWSVTDRSFGGVRYENVVECLYLIDMGEQQLTDEEGNPLGSGYSYIYGRTWFAPEIGPVAGQERSCLYGMRTAYEPEGNDTVISWAYDCVLAESSLPAE